MEERLLLADLLAATNRVANIAGTYGCFLSHWNMYGPRQAEIRERLVPFRQHLRELSADEVMTLYEIVSFP
jgi:adenine-specific DNA-methyltransferase